jgi:site-specific DNA recombinase
MDASTSPERQREAIAAMCVARGWDLVETVEDLNVSGSDRGDRLERPGLVRIRRRYGEVDVLVFTKLDRLARNVSDFRAIADDAERHGVALLSIDDNIDLTTASGKFFATILAAFAEMEAATIRERVLNGNGKARELGRFLGGIPPYGYRAVDNPDGAGSTLEPDPAEAAVVREMAASVLGGTSVYRVTQDLNDRGILSKKGQAWSVQAVRQVLTSPRIVGRRLHKGQVIDGPDGLPIQFDVPILALDTWKAVAARLASVSKGTRTQPSPKRLLSGLVSCGACGARMNPGPTGGDGKSSYRCSTASRGGDCKGISIRCEPLEAHLVQEFLTRFGGMRSIRVVESTPPEPAALGEVRAAIAATVQSMTDDSADVAGLTERLTRLKAERRRLEEAPTAPHTEVIELGTFADAWGSSDDVERRRNMLAGALHALRVHPGKAGRRPFNPDRLDVIWGEGNTTIDYGEGNSTGPARHVATLEK